MVEVKEVVSIITPMYNSEKYISRAISSVLSQTYPFWEMIIIDDCSSDNSVGIVKEFAARDSRIKLICFDKNSGAAVARNAGTEKASGRYIAFLDSDDLWFENKLDSQLEFMAKNSFAFVFSSYEKIDEENKVVAVSTVSSKVCYSDLLKLTNIGCLTVVYDSDVLGKQYMPLVRKRQDLGLWLKLLKLVPYGYGMGQVLAQYQLRSDSISANKMNAARYTWKLYRDVEELSFFWALYYFSHYAINGLLRTKFPKVAKLLLRSEHTEEL